jgi:lysophospholipase L1-like esterase
VLDRLWNSVPNAPRIEVFNLGTVGVNSSRVRQQFREILATLRPDLVTIMVGANDIWTVPAPLHDQESGWHYWLWSSSRAYRFFYMLSKLLRNASPQVGLRKTPEGPVMHVGDDVDLRWTAKGESSPEWYKDLQLNLEAMIADARKAGVDVVLLTYPFEGGFYEQANIVMRDTAAATQARLIDLGTEFLRACPSRDCADLFLSDGHPTARGHQLAAEFLSQQLLPVAQP